jgi:hypothetical protein
MPLKDARAAMLRGLSVKTSNASGIGRPHMSVLLVWDKYAHWLMELLVG